MNKYNRHSLALTDEEENKFIKVKKAHSIGVKKIFMAMLNSLEKTLIPPDTMDETLVGGQPSKEEEI